MSLSNYGILKGIPTHYRNSWQANNHYQVRISTGNDFFRIAVNVRSKENPKDLFFAIIDNFQHPIIDLVKDLGMGFTDIPRRPNSGAMDYIRGNLLDLETMRVLPDQQTGMNNDLNDHFDFLVQKAIQEEGHVYAFGERWFPAKPNDKYFDDTPDQGIHNIHMNQGNPKNGQFAGDNGVWQDGGILFHFPASDNWVAVFLRFQTQALHTDNQTGHPVIGEPVTDDINEVVKPTDATASYLRIASALVNPKGDDIGKEKVTLFNPSDQSINIDGWAIANNMKKKMPLQGNIGSGEYLSFTMTKEVPLSNNGGIITLLDKNGLKVHGVSYTKQQAGKQGFWLVFGSDKAQ